MGAAQQTERLALDAAIKRTTGRATTRRPRKASTALPYPDLPGYEASHALFWVAAWFRAQRQVDELEAHIARRYWSSYSEPLAHAFGASAAELRHAARVALGMVVDQGGLLFAWRGTTALATPQAAAQ